MDISEDGRHIVLEIESSPCYPTEVEGLVEREDAVEVRLHVGNVMPQDENVMCPPVLQLLRQEFTLASPLGGRPIERSASLANSPDT